MGRAILETAYGLPSKEAAALTSLLIAGFGVGAPVFGWLSDRMGRRKPPLLVGLALQTASLAAVIYIPDLPVSLIGCLCFLTGFLGSAQIVCFALAKETHLAGLSGKAIGFVNAMITGAGALFQPLVGLLLDLAWSGQVLHGARVYDAGAYRLALSSLVVCGLLGLLCVLAVRETFCRSADAHHIPGTSRKPTLEQ